MSPIASSREAQGWIDAARSDTPPDGRWEKAKAHLDGRVWEKHGDSPLYDEGDVRFILRIPLEDARVFYDILAGLADKAAAGDRKIFIGGAWREDGENGYYGIRVSQAVACYLARETGTRLEGSSSARMLSGSAH